MVVQPCPRTVCFHLTSLPLLAPHPPNSLLLTPRHLALRRPLFRQLSAARISLVAQPAEFAQLILRGGRAKSGCPAVPVLLSPAGMAASAAPRTYQNHCTIGAHPRPLPTTAAALICSEACSPPLVRKSVLIQAVCINAPAASLDYCPGSKLGRSALLRLLLTSMCSAMVPGLAIAATTYVHPVPFCIPNWLGWLTLTLSHSNS